ncbi:response regulator transcription factor [Burkholderia sp. Ac-20384]|uniref:response regulator n=1 Tax=Burkholderia sp. Ac-20384 TaxID=2703902 RepID=UPI001980F9E8|nr:response regulator transcription factor [Burkholderia sp. Ac-20384]MBN3827508.1 response regulator transcription factor [Burkholderia sp. Ac-20384]
MIRLLLVDDHTIFREGLKRLLAEQDEFDVIAEANDASEALSCLRDHPVDVALLDVNMPGRSGIDMLPSLRAEWPEMPVIVLSMYPAEQYAMRAFHGGASGYVTKDMDAVALVDSIRSVAKGGRYVTQAVANCLIDGFPRPSEVAAHQQLSSREYEIMLLIVRGIRLTDIGRQMFLSVKTVSTYRARLLKKLGVSSNAELARYAVEHRLID